VWKTVFTRLAPNEGFIPSFGIPSATKKTFDINLETTHRSGKVSGPPQMMLSAGNLNTAALSLFLALHLAVQPVVPCLVFDDPVQAMDEVHVAQFAGLIRLLSKQNGRQVIIAVHERELFDYLALELSPAYAGDELITIELGEREDDEDQGINRHTWGSGRSDRRISQMMHFVSEPQKTTKFTTMLRTPNAIGQWGR
jgi:exonuclease SbcC